MRWRPQSPARRPGPHDRQLHGAWEGECWLELPPPPELPDRVTIYYEGEPAGMLEMDWGNERVIENFGILIDQPFRGRGLGTALLLTFIELARDLGVPQICGFVREIDLDQRPFLLDWYNRHGFTIVESTSLLNAAQLSLRLA